MHIGHHFIFILQILTSASCKYTIVSTFVLTTLKVATSALAMRDFSSMRMDVLVMVCVIFIMKYPFGIVCEE